MPETLDLLGALLGENGDHVTIRFDGEGTFSVPKSEVVHVEDCFITVTLAWAKRLQLTHKCSLCKEPTGNANLCPVCDGYICDKCDLPVDVRKLPVEHRVSDHAALLRTAVKKN